MENLQVNKCEKCDKRFSTKGNLSSHMKSEHEQVKNACDRCDKSFIKTGGLYKYKKNCKVMADIPKTKR